MTEKEILSFGQYSVEREKKVKSLYFVYYILDTFYVYSSYV